MAHERDLISTEEFEAFIIEINTISVKLNNYIKTIGPS